jgi:glycerol-3-phosphate responsive antiterminator
MSYKLQFKEEHSIIEVIYNQETDYNTRLMALEEVVHYIKLKERKYNLLIDVQNIKTLLTTNQEYEFGVKLSTSKEIMGCQVAVLKKAQTDQNKFINTVAINRGYSLKVFTCYDEAFKWLKG